MTDYYYYADGRVQSIQQHGDGGDAVAEKRIDFTYDAAGNYAMITRYADLDGTELVATATYTFDAAYELTGLMYTDAGQTALASYGYTFDAAGNMTSMTIGIARRPLIRMTSRANSSRPIKPTMATRMTDNGNRTSHDRQHVHLRHGPDNQLLDDGTVLLHATRMTPRATR